MPKPRVTAHAMFGRGLYTDPYDGADLPKGALLTAENVSYDDAGHAYRSLGTRRSSVAVPFALKNSTANMTNTGIGGYADPVSNKLFITAQPTGGGQIDTYVSSDVTFPYTWTFMTEGVTPAPILGTLGLRPSYATLNTTVFRSLQNTTGSRLAYTTNYTSWTDAGTSLALTGLEVFNSRLFGITSSFITTFTGAPLYFSGTRLYYSELNDGTTIDDNFTDLAGYGAIQAIKAAGEALYVFHRNSISIFTGWSLDDISVLSGLRSYGNIGLQHPYALERAPDQSIYFAGSDGHFWTIDRAGTLKNISAGKLLQGCSIGWTTCTIDPAEGEVIWMNPSTTYPDGTLGATAGLVYHWHRDAWSTRTYAGDGTAPNAVFYHATRNAGGEVYTYSGDGHVRVFSGTKKDALSDDTGGTELTMVLETPKLLFAKSDPMAQKVGRFMYLRNVGTASLSPDVRWNGSSCSGNDYFGDTVRMHAPSSSYSNTVALRVESNASPRTYAFVDIVAEAFETGRRF